MNSSEQHKVGPRAKCDQVVYEAIAKAAEIIVRGRCICNNNESNNISSSNNSNNGSSARFHLEVEEIPSVRSILQMWKRSLHVPLRLDVYYEYCTDPANQSSNTRKELLERWCIDYTNTGGGSPHAHDASQYNYNHNHNYRHADGETIAQLRQVVKHIVIQLRILSSLTRMMPAYRLHHALMEDDQNIQFNNNRPLGGGPGLGGGYYQNTNHATNKHGYGNGIRMSNSESYTNQNAASAYRDLVGGKINYSFYVSDTPSSGSSASSDALFSSSTNEPFARHDLNPVPTPFGVLHLKGLFDAGLNVQGLLRERSRRIVNSVPAPLNGYTAGYESQLQGRDIGQHGNRDDGMQMRIRSDPLSTQMAEHRNGQMQITRNDQSHGHSKSYQPHHYRSHSCEPKRNLLNGQQQSRETLTRTKAIPIQQHQQGGDQGPEIQEEHGSVHRQQQHQQQQHLHHRSHSQEPRHRPHSLKQMSMPNQTQLGLGTSPSPDVVAEHFGNISIDRPKSAEPSHFRSRLSSDPGRGLIAPENKQGLGQAPRSEKRVLSGISLALMNEEEQAKEQVNQEQRQSPAIPSLEGGTPSSPLLNPSGSGENGATASMRQRAAFHHPPPSFDDSQSQGLDSVVPRAGSASPKTIPISQPSSLYGYGYNNGHRYQQYMIPPSSVSNFGSGANSRANSPSPLLMNTPPQPMFMPRGSCAGGNGITKISPTDRAGGIIQGKTKESKDDDVPFRNPTTLQQAPVVDTNASTLSATNPLHQPPTTSMPMQSSVQHTSGPFGRDALLPPLTSLDALASSPFKLSQSIAGGAGSVGASGAMPLSSSPGGVSAVFSSLVMGKGSAAFGPYDEGFPLALGSGGGSAAFASSLALPSRSALEPVRGVMGNQIEKEDYCEDMPFAVDMESSHGALSGSTPKMSRHSELGASSATNMSSQVVTSLAHKCSTAGRLRFFSNVENQQTRSLQGNGNSINVEKSVIDDQLNEFRSFGDSITASGLLAPPLKR